MGTLDATCAKCNAIIRWQTGTLRLCGQCRAEGEVSRRYVNIGREVWDTAWSDPTTGTWTSGLKRENVVTLYPSIQAAYEAAESLNDNEPKTFAERMERFAAAAANELAAAKEDREVRAKLLPDWVEGIDGLETL